MTQLTVIRTKPVMKNADIKKEACSKGYKFTGHSNWRCDACEEEMHLATQTVGYTNTMPPWANAYCALKFHKKGSTIAACRCGWRKDITIKFTSVKKPKCKVLGCYNIVGKKDDGGICQPCRKEIAGGGNPATYSQYCTLQVKPKNGCVHYMQGGSKDCIRIKCGNYDPIAAAMRDKIKICNRVNCNNPVPGGRTAVCYTCQPPPKEAASSHFNM